VKLRTRFILFSVFLTSLIVLATSYSMLHFLKQLVLEEIESNQVTLVENLKKVSEESQISKDDIFAYNYLTSLQKTAKGLAYALSACVIWGFSTVAGKSLLARTNATIGTFWRYFFGLLTLSAILLLARVPLERDQLLSYDSVVTLTYLSLVSGLIPMLAYYGGLKRTRASVATFIELLYPVGAVVLNTVFLHTPLSAVQMAAGAVLLFAVTMITL
jgi:drug/metabolite transporter (DMT)-like permease